MTKSITNLVTNYKVKTSKLVKQMQLQKQKQKNRNGEDDFKNTKKFKFFTLRYNDKICLSLHKRTPHLSASKQRSKLNLQNNDYP